MIDLRRIALLLLAVSTPLAAGCALGPDTPQVYENPALVQASDRDFLWDKLVDVVDDHFTIEREEPVRQIGDVLTEGRIETFPEGGSTIFEPWRSDSANGYEKLESTLQTIRRQCFVKVVPANNGYLVDVAVFKELEDLPRPEQSTAASGIFRYDSSLDRAIQPVTERTTPRGWIPLGRDAALEQHMIRQLRERTAGPPVPWFPMPAPNNGQLVRPAF